METLTGGGGAVMATVAEPDLAGLATDLAVTLNPVPAVLPAVNNPVEETVPPVAVQVTAVLDVPVTVAVNCCVWPV